MIVRVAKQATHINFMTFHHMQIIQIQIFNQATLHNQFTLLHHNHKLFHHHYLLQVVHHTHLHIAIKIVKQIHQDQIITHSIKILTDQHMGIKMEVIQVLLDPIVQILTLLHQDHTIHLAIAVLKTKELSIEE